MNIRKASRRAWIGLALIMWIGMDGATNAAEVPQSSQKAKTEGAAVKEPVMNPEASRAASPGAIKVQKGDSAAPLVAKAEASEAKTRRNMHGDALKAVRAEARKMDLDYVRETREREVSRKEAEKAGKTRVIVPSEPEGANNAESATGLIR